MTPLDTIQAYEQLVERAVIIAAAFPKYVPDDSILGLDIEDETATLRWQSPDTDWDVPVLRSESYQFPAKMLLWSDEEISAWGRKLAAEREVANAAERRNRRMEQEAHERAVYLQLKQKFEA